MRIQVSSYLAPIQQVLLLLLAVGLLIGGLWCLLFGNWISLVFLSGGAITGFLWHKYLRNYVTVWIEGDTIWYSSPDGPEAIDRSLVIASKYVSYFVKRPMQVTFLNGQNQEETFCFLPGETSVRSGDGDHLLSLDQFFRCNE
jgi:hypothetical protein